MRALKRGSHKGYREATVEVWGRVALIAHLTPIGWFILQWTGGPEGPPAQTTVEQELRAVFECRP